MQRHRLLLPTVIALACLAALPAHAINIQLDYTYDSTNFFAPGSQARASLQAAATFFSSILDDTFSAITVPEVFDSSLAGSDGTYTWSWAREITHPATGNPLTINNGNIAANQYVIYAGARPFNGTTAGEGGPGGYSTSGVPSCQNCFTSSDVQNINAINAAFEDAVVRRGETSGFARWGGSISFDTSSRNWHLNHTTAPAAGTTDLYSVAIHELAHTLGLGSSTEWNTLLSGSNFTGVNARSWYNTIATVPTASGAHWAEGTTSLVYGTTTAQEASMDPSINNGTRKRFTDLDAAALKDIGWDIDTLYGDYDASREVDVTDYVLWRLHNGQNGYMRNDQTLGTIAAADYNVWRSNYGNGWADPVGGASFQSTPEPSAAMLAIFAYIAACATRRNRRS